MTEHYNSKSALVFIKEKKYKDNNELHKALRKIINTQKYSAEILTELGGTLTREEHTKLLNLAFKKPETAYHFALNYPHLDIQLRLAALETITKSERYTRKFIINNETSTLEKLFIVNKFKNNGNILYFQFKRCNNDTYDKKVIYDILMEKHPRILYILSIEGHLNYKQLREVYEKHSTYLYKMCSKNCESYFQYCKLFNDFISDKERNKLIKMVTKLENKDYIKPVIKKIKLSKDLKDQLNGYMIAYTLAAL